MKTQKLTLSGIFTALVSMAFTLAVFLLFLFSIFGDVYLSVYEQVYYIRDNLWLNLLALVTLLVLGTYISCYRKIKLLPLEPSIVFLKKFTVVYAVCMLIFVISLQNYPDADQYNCFAAGSELARGIRTSWETGGYMDLHPHQNGWVLCLAFLSKILGTGNILFLQMFQVAALIICAAYLAKIIYLLFEQEKLAKICYLTALLFFPINCFVVFVYGILPGFMLSLIGLHKIILFIKKGNCKLGIKGMLLIGVAYCLKSNFIFFLLSAVLLLVIEGLEKKRKDCLGVAVAGVLILILMGRGLNGLVEAITHEKVDGMPKISWLLMGLQEGPYGNGMYNGITISTYMKADCNPQIAQQMFENLFEERVRYFAKNPEYTVTFFLRKAAAMWNEGSFEGMFISGYRPTTIARPGWIRAVMCDGYLANAVILKLLNLFLVFLWFGILLYLFLQEKKNWHQSILPIVFLAGFVFHFFWEIKSQYAVTYVYLILPYMIIGYQKAFERIGETFQKKKKQTIRIWNPFIVMFVIILLMEFVPVKLVKETFRYDQSEQYNAYSVGLKNAIADGTTTAFFQEIYDMLEGYTP